MASSAPNAENAHLLAAFASKVAALQPDAWDRIGARCVTLEDSSFEALLGRAGLVARAFTPEADLYARPLLQPGMTALGALVGIFFEVSQLFGPSDPVKFEEAAERHRAHSSGRDPQFEAFLRIEAAAQRQRLRHPGTAAALNAVALAILGRGMIPEAQVQKLYAPFEPEIPYATLQGGPEEHAA